jgi:hypothetical protein
MLTIEGGPKTRFCDGVSRRDFLKIGGLAMGGLSLPQLLAAEAAAGKRPGHKAVIMVFLCGGPPHQDMFDLKPEAPSQVRGEFKPIRTNVPGIEICELMPRLARCMDKAAIVRSLVGARDEHATHLCYSGYTTFEYRQGNWPALGSVVSKVQGATQPTVPPFVNLSQPMSFTGWAHPGEAGFLGIAHRPFQPHGPVAQDMALKAISLPRLQDRRRLLASVDRFRREADSFVEGTGSVTQRALDLLTSNRVLEALDVEKEDPKIRERYGRGSLANVDDGGPMWNDGILLARRLVEAGVRVVTIGYGRWDYHGKNFQQCRDRLPLLDQGVSALIEDLYQRGLDKDVSVCVWGDFGRTPRINGEAGRDHWPAVSCALLAGGGMRTGQVIGSTTPDGGYADLRPVHYKDVMATLYHNLGIDTSSLTIPGVGERPTYLLTGHGPVEELVG